MRLPIDAPPSSAYPMTLEKMNISCVLLGLALRSAVVGNNLDTTSMSSELIDGQRIFIVPKVFISLMNEETVIDNKEIICWDFPNLGWEIANVCEEVFLGFFLDKNSPRRAG